MLRALTDRGDDADTVADLCEMSARRDPALKGSRPASGDSRLLSTSAALDVRRDQAPLDQSKVQVNMRAAPPSRSSPAGRRRAGRRR
jgi:hypothetical protein